MKHEIDKKGNTIKVCKEKAQHVLIVILYETEVRWLFLMTAIVLFYP